MNLLPNNEEIKLYKKRRLSSCKQCNLFHMFIATNARDIIEISVVDKTNINNLVKKNITSSYCDKLDINIMKQIINKYINNELETKLLVLEPSKDFKNYKQSTRYFISYNNFISYEEKTKIFSKIMIEIPKQLYILELLLKNKLTLNEVSEAYIPLFEANNKKDKVLIK